MSKSISDISIEEFNIFNDMINNNMISVQAEHQTWFDNRPIGKDGIGPNLIDHYTFRVEGPVCILEFVLGSDLPEEIKSMCYQTYDETLNYFHPIIR